MDGEEKHPLTSASSSWAGALRSTWPGYLSLSPLWCACVLCVWECAVWCCMHVCACFEQWLNRQSWRRAFTLVLWSTNCLCQVWALLYRSALTHSLAPPNDTGCCVWSWPTKYLCCVPVLLGRAFTKMAAPASRAVSSVATSRWVVLVFLQLTIFTCHLIFLGALYSSISRRFRKFTLLIIEENNVTWKFSLQPKRSHWTCTCARLSWQTFSSLLSHTLSVRVCFVWTSGLGRLYSFSCLLLLVLLFFLSFLLSCHAVFHQVFLSSPWYRESEILSSPIRLVSQYACLRVHFVTCSQLSKICLIYTMLIICYLCAYVTLLRKQEYRAYACWLPCESSWVFLEACHVE